MIIRIGSRRCWRCCCWPAAEAADDRHEAGGRLDASATSSEPERVGPREVDPNGFPLPERPDCAADAGGTFVRATTSEGNGVGFLLIGTGSGGVVLGPQDDGDICQWLPYAEELATTYRVALFDWEEPRAEVPCSRSTRCGTPAPRRSCWGGVVRRRARAVRGVPGAATAGRRAVVRRRAHAPRLRRPARHQEVARPAAALSSERRSYFDSQNARRLRVLHPGPETILMLPGSAHGVSMLDGPQQQQVRSTVDRTWPASSADETDEGASGRRARDGARRAGCCGCGGTGSSGSYCAFTARSRCPTSVPGRPHGPGRRPGHDEVDVRRVVAVVQRGRQLVDPRLRRGLSSSPT